MKTKALEIRDEMTFIAALAIDMNPVQSEGYDHQRYLLRRCGYPCDGRPNVILTRLDGNGQATNDPYAWGGGSRTMQTAHHYIIDNWETLKDGDVVDVSFILKETKAPKVSERVAYGPEET